VAVRAVFPSATKNAGDHIDDYQQDHDEADDPKDVHPAWCAGGRSPVGPHAGVVAGVGVRGHVSHVCLLLNRA
jgi:hypothetical protein